MSERTDGDPAQTPERAPLGSWAVVYALVVVLALAVMALLYWFTESYNLRIAR